MLSSARFPPFPFDVNSRSPPYQFWARALRSAKALRHLAPPVWPPSCGRLKICCAVPEGRGAR
eukprot:8033677-Lingulodinium_polyedra.AAC.1